MKRAKLVATILAALARNGAAVTLSNDAQLALDKAVDEEIDAEDGMIRGNDESEEDYEERKKAAKDKRAKDASAAVTPGPKDGEKGKSITADSLPALLAGYVTTEQAAKLAQDAAASAVTAVNALHKARKDVEPLVGVVALDSAEAVYRFTLEKSGVAFDGVPPAAFGALVEQVKATKAAKASGPVSTGSPRFASDSASAAAAAIPGLGRFNIG